MSTIKTNSLFRLLVGLLLGIFALWLIYSLLFSAGIGVRIGYGGYHEGGHMYMGTGIGLGGTVAYLLLFFIKALFVLFIVGLVVGIAIAIKNYVFTEEDVKKIKSSFTGGKTLVVKEVCGLCGKELEDDWKVCPHCGKELNS